MDPIQERLTFFEKTRRKFKKKKHADITNSDPYDTKITQYQADVSHLHEAFIEMGMSMDEASQILQRSLSEVSKVWTNGK